MQQDLVCGDQEFLAKTFGTQKTVGLQFYGILQETQGSNCGFYLMFGNKGHLYVNIVVCSNYLEYLESHSFVKKKT